MPPALHLALSLALVFGAAVAAGLAAAGVVPGGPDVPLLAVMVGAIVLWGADE
tara:strand:+ start:665 stop:823 length:159 start_codon:yes stop_codon:yes gene_type:complete